MGNMMGGGGMPGGGMGNPQDNLKQVALRKFASRFPSARARCAHAAAALAHTPEDEDASLFDYWQLSPDVA